MRRLATKCAGALLAFVLVAGVLGGQALQKDSLAGMKYRLIGPFRGGRAEAVTGVIGNPSEWYFGAAGGGVWKTDNAGQSWRPIFDHEPVSSIGAIAVAPSDPNIVYVGTGEECFRGDISYGNGMYKSLDGGATWTHIGLDDSRHIARVLIDPHDPNRVFVAAEGHAFGPNAERGIFRSLDGGKTWQKVLYVNDQTGAVDLTFDGNNPHVLFAAMYQQVRKPWTFIGGGPGSGLYKSTDDGATWKHLEGHGLPSGILGKIGVAVSAADPNRVYALIVAHKGSGLYESNDTGATWHFITGDHRFLERAFYYIHVFADPHDANTIWILNTSTYRSTDQGKTWQTVHAGHGDCHGFWINPANSRWMIEGNDGGATISTDGGTTWSTQNNQPTAQFYHVATDNQLLYYVYGAQQDNTTVAIASATNHGAIGPGDWYQVGGGESGYVAPEPKGQIVYAGGNYGIITRWDKATDQAHLVTPDPVLMDGSAAADQKYRFQWTAPIVFDPLAPNTLYIGAQVLFRSTDNGQHWTAISPDLTRNDKSKQQIPGGPLQHDSTSVEFYDTIFTIAPSSIQHGLIWAGSDDGLIHITRDAGAHWTDVTPPGLPAWSKISLIEASPFAAGTAYAAVNRNKNDDLAPYIYRTRDFGATWTKIVNGIPDGSYVHAVREDPKRQGLLYAATETGVYVSFNDGDQWQSLKLNMPTVSIRDLAIHDDDLVVATHGRAFWILDDLNPLRQMSDAALTAPVHLFNPPPAYRFHGGSGFFGRNPTSGANPPAGVILDYELHAAPSGNISLEILDAKGTVIRTYSSKPPAHPPHPPTPGFGPPPARLPKKAGLNRFVWNLRYQTPTALPHAVYDNGPPVGVLALPGHYETRLTVDGQTYTAPITVVPDPRVHTSMADLEAQFNLATGLCKLITLDHSTVLEMRSLDAQLKLLGTRLAADPSPAVSGITTAAKDIGTKMTALEGKLVSLESTADEDQLNYGNMLSSQLSYLEGGVEDGDTAPTAADVALAAQYRTQLDQLSSQWRSLLSTDVAHLNDLMRQAHIPALGVTPPRADPPARR
ncbi:MAG: glycosyl hydrolase [Acidobacteria bacterium]|nr:MAG: glycosyl hydrolase [Acidobacteriota bacterium]